MDNTVTPYTLQTESSDESNSSDSSEEGNLLTNNIGVLYNGGDIKGERFMNQGKVEDYLIKRNLLFTKDIDTIDLLVDSYGLDKNNYDFDLQTTYKNVIGIELIRSMIQQPSSGTLGYKLIDVIVDQVPYKYCIQNKGGKHIIDRVPTNTTNKHIIQHEPNFLSYKKGFFFPISLNKISILLQIPGTSPTEYNTDMDNSFIFRITILQNLDLLK